MLSLDRDRISAREFFGNNRRIEINWLRGACQFCQMHCSILKRSGRFVLSKAAGAFPLVPFRKNATGLTPPFDTLWCDMHQFFIHNQDEFLQHYHRRSNVETTFSIIKLKFGTFLRSKTMTAQVNELLGKVLCDNLCYLVSATYKLGVGAGLWAA